jgi:hypothetical protein
MSWSVGIPPGGLVKGSCPTPRPGETVMLDLHLHGEEGTHG